MRIIRSGPDTHVSVVHLEPEGELGEHEGEVHAVGTDTGMTAVVVQAAQLSLASDVVADGASS